MDTEILETFLNQKNTKDRIRKYVHSKLAFLIEAVQKRDHRLYPTSR